MLGVLLTALGQMLKLLIYIAFGYLMCRRGYLGDEMIHGLMAIITRFLIPVMIFNSLQLDYSPSLLKQGMVISFLFLLSAVVAFFLACLCLKSRRLTLSPCAVADWKFDALFSNAGFVGMPVVVALFNSQEAMFYCCCVIVTLNVFFGSIGEELYGIFGGREQKSISLKKLLKSPILAAMTLGILFFFLRIRIPSFLSECFTTISSIIGPLVMFSLGALMTKGKFTDTFRDGSYYLLVLIRMIVAPLVAWAIGHLLTNHSVTLIVTMIMCAMPGPAAAAPLSLEYGDAVWASRYVIVSTLLSVVTLPVLYALATIW